MRVELPPHPFETHGQEFPQEHAQKQWIERLTDALRTYDNRDLTEPRVFRAHHAGGFFVTFKEIKKHSTIYPQRSFSMPFFLSPFDRFCQTGVINNQPNLDQLYPIIAADKINYGYTYTLPQYREANNIVLPGNTIDYPRDLFGSTPEEFWRWAYGSACAEFCIDKSEACANGCGQGSENTGE